MQPMDIPMAYLRVSQHINDQTVNANFTPRPANQRACCSPEGANEQACALSTIHKEVRTRGARA